MNARLPRIFILMVALDQEVVGVPLGWEKTFGVRAM